MRDIDLATVPRAEFSAQLRNMQNIRVDDLDDNVYAQAKRLQRRIRT